MLWAEKITGEATERAEKSAQSMLNTMIWAEKQKKKQLNILKSLPKACKIRCRGQRKSQEKRLSVQKSLPKACQI